MPTKLPKVLENEPLIDAVFEFRLSKSAQLADILPGYLFHELSPKPTLSRLPPADIPAPIRLQDPALKFAPTQRIDWGQYLILVGDQNVVIGCKLPYPKWPNFKAAILDIVKRIETVGIQGEVDRYSIKYVNIIKAPTFAEQIAKIKIEINLGEIHVIDEQVSLRVQRVEGDTLHILSVTTGAEASLPSGERVVGAVVDVDSIRDIPPLDFKAFCATLNEEVENLRQSNKEKFFSCLMDDTILEMGPKYE